jgi:hypothetical protein
MHFNAWLTLAFTASAIARPDGVVDSINKRDVNNVNSLPAIKNTIEVLKKDGDELDKAIAALTKENVATQIDVINSKLNKLGSDSSAQAAKMKASGAVGIFEVSGLLSSATQATWTTLLKETFQVVNQTSIDIMAKRDIVKDSGKIDSIATSIRAQKKGIMDIIAVIPGQVPAAVKNQVSSMAAKAASSAAAQATAGAAAPKMPQIPDINDPKVQETLGKAIDGFLEQVINIVSGKQESFTLPALPPGMTLPAGMPGMPGMPGAPAAAAGGMGDMPGMPGMDASAPAPAAPMATAAPSVPTVPKAAPPKMSGMPGMAAPASPAPMATAAPSMPTVPKAAPPKMSGMPKMPMKGTGGSAKGAKGPAVEFVERRF